MCCVGDIGDSLEDPVRYSIHTLWEMQVLGMAPQKEDWEHWTLPVRDETFQSKVRDFNPALFDYFKTSWEEKAR